MKRSEMIEIIEAELYMIQNIEGNNQEFLTSIAKGILDRIEECGMLPPEYLNQDKQKGRSIPFYSNEWEDDND